MEQDDYMLLRRFVPSAQLSTTIKLCAGEEGEFFKAKLKELAETFRTMPKTGETNGQGVDAIVHLHYFSAHGDWWVSELDKEGEQLEAFGFVCLAGMADCAELGAISIEELCERRKNPLHNVELDYHWTKTPLREIQQKTEQSVR